MSTTAAGTAAGWVSIVQEGAVTSTTTTTTTTSPCAAVATHQAIVSNPGFTRSNLTPHAYLFASAARISTTRQRIRCSLATNTCARVTPG
ncbi:hypothetical protein [Candidatus Microthrix parvicella]|uniref:hypothetical protein n=1 Tax=Candidatus Neomicrothrix parvicella TaxID=41950 RepID=UPI0004CE9BD1|nr:hypothetical protein [Candidatus Microthrix parvicella]